MYQNCGFVEGFEPYSRRATPLRGGTFVLCCAKAQRSREQLCSPRWKASFPTRLRCVICAPRAFGLRRCADWQILSSSPKRKKRNTRKGIPFFWRRRKDLNLRAGYPTYTLSRGASSPLEYFSTRTVVSIRLTIITSIFLFVK